MPHKESPDMQAVRLLLKGDNAGLRRLAAKVKAQLENRITCPACGSEGPHEDNGLSGTALTYCCCACGEHFDAEPLCPT